jgi:hypothetical protein
MELSIRHPKKRAIAGTGIQGILFLLHPYQILTTSQISRSQDIISQKKQKKCVELQEVPCYIELEA